MPNNSQIVDEISLHGVDVNGNEKLCINIALHVFFSVLYILYIYCCMHMISKDTSQRACLFTYTYVRGAEKVPRYELYIINSQVDCETFLE